MKNSQVDQAPAAAADLPLARGALAARRGHDRLDEDAAVDRVHDPPRDVLLASWKERRRLQTVGFELRSFD